ncbi:15690_t:CDS:2 [Funneliformis geosporum]|uniref:3809_t:CDS:1 n=1 Tax=Funneliformis geosporum TaxID=1117311 RepID=A0A9W4SNK4_9GLOM|nr:15690_t:CDS:2 [Funneliformis geosporum]CAI2175837.1 3809_t:CDS:2 [Funneliformis geosporum]
MIDFDLISKTIGWAYFFAWSISFYPQVILNYRRKSVQGLSIDFLWYNVYGFACYSIFNLAFFASEGIRDEYRLRNGDKSNLVQINDVVFALHALTLSAITLIQTFIYKRDSYQRISPVAFSLITMSFLGIFLLLIGVFFGINQWIDLLYYMSYVKLCLSFVKYVPQAFLNFKRKSTIGWSIHNILLYWMHIYKITGMEYQGQVIDKDLAKLGLGFLSVSFDLLFMTQHYVLYHNPKDHNSLTDENDDNDFSNNDDLENTRLLSSKSLPRYLP